MDTYNLTDLYPFYPDMCKILIGTPVYGDDGEDAVIINVYFSDNTPFIKFEQDDGVCYDFPLAEYLDNIELDEEDYNTIQGYLEEIAEEDEQLHESLSYKPTNKIKKKRKLILDEEEKPTKYSTRKDWRHKR